MTTTEDPNQTAPKKSVIVVGAGAAGIKLAHTLLLASDATKFDEIILLDANHYMGGRVRHFSFQGHTVEMGANWISGRESAFDNPIWKLAQAIQLQGHPSERENPNGVMVLDCCSKDPSTASDDMTQQYLEQVKRFDDVYDRALAARKQAEEAAGYNPNTNTNTSVRHVLEQHGWTPKRQLSDIERAVEHNVLEVWVAETLEDLSAEYDMRPGANDVELGQDEVFVEDSRGLNSIFQGMIHDLQQSSSVTIQLETEVQSIYYAPGNVKVVAKDLKVGTMKEYHATAVVSTVSIGVLQSNAMTFVPPLPEWKVAALRQMQMFNFAKVYAKFDRPLWPNEKDYLIFVTSGEQKRGQYPLWMKYKNTTDPNNHLLMCYLGGAQARRVESLTEEQLKNEIEDLFFQGFGGSRKDCRPVAVAVTDWSRNPRFCGSYSYYPKGAFASVPYENLARGLTGVPEGDQENKAASDSSLPITLYFAGEAFDDKYNGWIQGGYLSGERVAKSMLAS
jgi:polyamine oxidase